MKWLRKQNHRDKTSYPHRGPWQGHLQLDDKGNVDRPISMYFSFGALRNSARAVSSGRCPLSPASLWHLSREPPPGFGQGWRRHPGRGDTPHCQDATGTDAHGPVRAVPCPPLLPSGQPRPRLRHGRQPGHQKCHRPDRGQSGAGQEGGMARSFGQSIIETLGAKKVHPNHAIPGGVNTALSSRPGMSS